MRLISCVPLCFLLALAFYSCSPAPANQEVAEPVGSSNADTSTTSTASIDTSTNLAIEEESPAAAAPEEPEQQMRPNAPQKSTAMPPSAPVAKGGQRRQGFYPREVSIITPASLCQDKYPCLLSKIYALGWSEDGLFAYMQTKPGEAVDRFWVQTVVLDTKTNSVAWEQTFDESKLKSFSEPSKYSIQKYWEDYGEVIQEALTIYNVSPASFEVNTLENAASNGVSVKMSTQEEVSDFTGSNILTSANISVGSRKGATKNLPAISFGKYDLALKAAVAGYIKSPIGGYAVLPIAIEQRGYEGPPNKLVFRMVGGVWEGDNTK